MSRGRRPPIDFSGLLVHQQAHGVPRPQPDSNQDPNQTHPGRLPGHSGQQSDGPIHIQPDSRPVGLTPRRLANNDAGNTPFKCQPGGYSEDIVIDLSEDEKQKFECNICYLVLRDPRQCPNKHLFCATCIITWSLSTNVQSRDKCPVCRAPGRYRPDFKTEAKLNRKRISCPAEGCSWIGSLASYKKHKLKHQTDDSAEAEPEIPPIIVPSVIHGIAGFGNVNTNSNPAQPTNHPPNSQTNASRQLETMFESFGRQLQQRRSNIDRFYYQREQQRRENLAEVHHLGQRLDHVASDLNHMLGNMTRDRDRYRNYIRASQDAEDSLLHLSISTPLPRASGISTRNTRPGTGDTSLALDLPSNLNDWQVHHGQGTSAMTDRQSRLSGHPRSSSHRNTEWKYHQYRRGNETSRSITTPTARTVQPPSAGPVPSATRNRSSSRVARKESNERGAAENTGQASANISFRSALNQAMITSSRRSSQHRRLANSTRVLEQRE